jgi:hypothetical protein
MFSKSIGALNASNNSLEAFPKTPCLVKIVARIKAEKADQLKQAASNSFGVKFAQEAFTFQLRSMIQSF